MRRWWRTRLGTEAGQAPDPVVSAALESWDPQARDPGYWMRFQARTVALAGPELARRRLMASLTIGDVLAGWARALVPAAAVAAGVAVAVLLRSADASRDLTAASTVEELLVADMGRETIPETLSRDETGAWAAFAGERF